MSQFNYDIEVTKGATNRESFTWKPGGVAADLTGCTASFEARLDPNSASSSLSTGVTVTLGGTAGTIEMVFPPSAVSGSWKSARYRLLITHPNGEVTPLISGNLISRSGFE